MTSKSKDASINAEKESSRPRQKGSSVQIKNAWSISKRGVSKVEERGINIGRSENTCQNHRNQNEGSFLKKKGMSRRKKYVEKKIIPKRKHRKGQVRAILDDRSSSVPRLTLDAMRQRRHQDRGNSNIYSFDESGNGA